MKYFGISFVRYYKEYYCVELYLGSKAFSIEYNTLGFLNGRRFIFSWEDSPEMIKYEGTFIGIIYEKI